MRMEVNIKIQSQFYSLSHFCTGISEKDGNSEPPDGNPPRAPSFGPCEYMSWPRNA